MKIAPRDIQNFLKAPNPAARVILVYGPDTGLMKERTAILGKTVIEDLNDPFNAFKLNAASLQEDPARLSDEANAMSMMGGDRLIRVEDAGDKLTTLIKAYLENPSEQSLILLEAGNLGPRSSLRKLCESAKNAAALPCYVEDQRDLGRLIQDRIREAGLQIDRDAGGWLAAHITGDRARAQSEIEKLITYKGKDTSPITVIEAMEICGAAGASSLDELITATATGQTAAALKHFEKLMQEGINFIVILRSLQNHLKRLHQARSAMDSGAQTDAAMKQLSPPVFFKQQNAFRAQLNRWSSQKINIALKKVMDIEADCKKNRRPRNNAVQSNDLRIVKNGRLEAKVQDQNRYRLHLDLDQTMLVKLDKTAYQHA